MKLEQTILRSALMGALALVSTSTALAAAAPGSPSVCSSSSPLGVVMAGGIDQIIFNGKSYLVTTKRLLASEAASPGTFVDRGPGVIQLPASGASSAAIKQCVELLKFAQLSGLNFSIKGNLSLAPSSMEGLYSDLGDSPCLAKGTGPDQSPGSCEVGR